MKKQTIVLLISLLSILACFLIVIMTVLIFQDSERPFSSILFKEQCNLVNTSRVNISDIDKIDISYYSDPVTFYESEGEELVLEEYMNWWEEPMSASVTKKDGVIAIKSGERPKATRFRGLQTEIKIYLPKSYHGSLEVTVSSGAIYSEMNLSLHSAVLNSTSGMIMMEHLSTAQDITVKSSSGALDFGTLEAGSTCSLTSNSGAIRAKSIRADSLSLSASSGSVRLDEATADTITGNTSSGKLNILEASGNMNLNSNSGSIHVEGEGQGEFNASSGSVDVDLDAVHGNIKVNTNSGSIRLALPNTLEFAFEAESNSGSIRTDFDDQLSFNKRGNSVTGQIGQNDSINVCLSASSGSIDVTH